MATDRNGAIYEGAFGKRVLGQPAAMTLDTVVWIASMTKALTAAGAMQLVEQGKLDLDAPAAKIVPDIAKIEVLEGFDAGGQPRTRTPKRADHAAPPAHPHGRLRLRHLERRYPASTRGQEDSRRHQLPERGADDAAAVRSRRPVGLRHQHRLGGQDGGGRQRQEARRLPAENLFAPLGMSSTAFKITPDMRARLAKVHQRGDKDALRAANGPGDPAGAGVRDGRRRPLRRPRATICSSCA